MVYVSATAGGDPGRGQVCFLAFLREQSGIGSSTQVQNQTEWVDWVIWGRW